MTVRTDGQPLHHLPIGDDDWYACQYPDRDIEHGFTTYEDRCILCLERAAEDLELYGDTAMLEWDINHNRYFSDPESFSKMIEDGKSWVLERALRLKFGD